MVADSIGIYVDGFVGDSVLDTNAYDMGIGIGLRFMY